MMPAYLTRRPAIAACVLGGLGALIFCVHFYLRERQLNELGRPIRYIAAARDIAPLTRIEPQMIATLTAPRRFIAPGALTNETKVIGSVTRTALAAGEPITNLRVVSQGDSAGLSSIVPSGMRAVSIAVDEVSGVTGLIEPGNRVDILGTFDFGDSSSAQSFTMTLLEDVRVLSVGRHFGLFDYAKREAQEKTVTLALAADQSQKVVFATENGRIRLALRPQNEETDRLSSFSREPATAASVTGRGDLVRRKEYRGK